MRRNEPIQPTISDDKSNSSCHSTTKSPMLRKKPLDMSILSEAETTTTQAQQIAIAGDDFCYRSIQDHRTVKNDIRSPTDYKLQVMLVSDIQIGQQKVLNLKDAIDHLTIGLRKNPRLIKVIHNHVHAFYYWAYYYLGFCFRVR